MAAQRQAALDPGHDPDGFDGFDDDPGFEPVHVPGDGPHDVENLDPQVTLGAGTVDFGAVRVPVPERGTVTVEPSDEGRMQAVHISVPEGRLSVSALAAPRSSRLWPDLVKEIDASLREGGARVRSFQGDWGRELHATSGAATSVFVGVDGSRWMLYGVATGPTRDAGALDEQLRRMMRGTIVVRGRSPYPVRTVLPLEVPEHLAAVPIAADTVAVATPIPTAVEGGSVVETRRAANGHEPASDPSAAGRRSADGTRHRAVPGGAFPAEQTHATARPAAAVPPTTARPVAGPAATWASGWSPPADDSPPTTALPVAGPPPVDITPPTGGMSVAGGPSRRGPADDTPLWSDPVHRIADPGGPLPFDAGPDPDVRPTDIRPTDVRPTDVRPGEIRPGGVRPEPAEVPPTDRWAAVGPPDGSETAPWALDPPPVPSSGGRRRLRGPDAEQGGHRPVSPGLTGPWPPWPDSSTGPRRPVDGGPRSGRRRAEAPALDRVAALHADDRRAGGPVLSPTDLPGSGRRRAEDLGPGAAIGPDGGYAAGSAEEVRPGRRPGGPADASPAPPRSGRRRASDRASTAPTAVAADVLRLGRHAAVDQPSDRTGRGAETPTGRGAETQPWAPPRTSRPETAPGSIVDTASWGAVPQAGSGLVTEPLAVVRPAEPERPSGRHHRLG